MGLCWDGEGRKRKSDLGGQSSGSGGGREALEEVERGRRVELPRAEGGGDKNFIEGTQDEGLITDGEGAGAGGDDADEALAIVAGDGAAMMAFADTEAGRAFGADERVLKGVGAERTGAARGTKGFGRHAVAGPAAEIEDIEAELEATAHEARALGEGVATAFEFEAHDEIAGLHDFREQETRAEGVGHASGDDQGVPDFDRDAVETGFEAGDILGGDEVAELVAGRRPLESEIQIRRMREIVADGEEVVGLGFSRRGVEEFLGKRRRRVSLEMKPDRGVEELDEELGTGAKAGGVGGAEVVGGVGGEEVCEIMRRRVVATVDSGEAR